MAFSHSGSTLVMAECACAILTFTSFNDAPSLVCMDPRYLNWPLIPAFSIHPYVCRWSWLDAVDENFAFVGADFHAVFSSSFLWSFRESLEFFTGS